MAIRMNVITDSSEKMKVKANHEVESTFGNRLDVSTIVDSKMNQVRLDILHDVDEKLDEFEVEVDEKIEQEVGEAEERLKSEFVPRRLSVFPSLQDGADMRQVYLYTDNNGEDTKVELNQIIGTKVISSDINPQELRNYDYVFHRISTQPIIEEQGE